MGLIVDTSIPISAERRGQSVEQLVAGFVLRFGPVIAALSTVTVVELIHGIYRAKTQQQETQRRSFTEEILQALPIVPLNVEIARLAGRIEGEQAAKGIIIAFEDLVIGATALHLGYDVLTLNVRHFQMIPGLRVLTY